MSKWQFWIDRGGTFTDVVAISPDGALQRTKLLSEDPSRSEDAAIHAIRAITGTPEGPLPPCELRIGTTVATNALLERKGARVALAITAGFEDALRIGSQERPELFARQIVLPDPIYDRVIGIGERVLADGTVEQPLDEDRARAELAKAKADGIDAVAICLMHGYRHTAHEEALAAISSELGFAQISVSHSLAPLIKLVSRGDTTVLDAYVSPPLREYTSTVAGGLGDAGEALFMQSNGGLTAREQFHGKDAILSGPAGGIVGMAATAEEAGFAAVVGFDMGGTSTDVSWYSGQYERDGETRLEGVRIAAPMMRIHTVASGGGSICRFEAGRFHVGPESAGAFPGPACYRNDGPLTVTDCNLALGKLQPAHFPPVFGPDGNLPPDRDIVMTKLASLCDRIEAETGRKLSPMEAAEGFIAIAVQDMAQAIKAISIRRGHDIAGAALAAFGGAGGQHACLVAEALGIDVVQCHPLASVLSAYGMGLADRRAMREATLAVELGAEATAGIAAELDALASEAGAELTVQGVGADDIAYERSLQLRPAGTENTLEIAFGDADLMASRFRKGWRDRFGFEPEGAIVVATARVEAVSRSPERPGAPLAPARPFAAGPPDDRELLGRAKPRHSAVPQAGFGRRIRGRRPGADRRRRVDHRRRTWLEHRSRRDWQCAAAPDRRGPPPRDVDRARSGAHRDHGRLVHGDRRGNGRGPAGQRQLGQYSRTARFFLRNIRPGRKPDRQCAAHAGASWINGRKRSHGSAAPQRGRPRHPQGRCLCAERAL